MARGTTAVPRQMPLAPQMTGTVARDPPPPPALPPPYGGSGVRGWKGNVIRLAGEQGGRGAQRLEMTASLRPSRPTLVPSPRGAPPMGRAGSEFRLTGEHWGWDVRQLRATAGQCPRPPVLAPRPAEAPAPAPRTDPPPPLTPSRLRTGLTLVVMAAGSAPVGSPSGCARGPEPQAQQLGDGSGAHSVAGRRPGGGRGPHTGVGRSRNGMGPSRRGAVAVPGAGRSQGRAR